MHHLLSLAIFLLTLALPFLTGFLSATGENPFGVENIAPRASLSFKQCNFATEAKYPFETLGGAVAALDYNNGFLDLLFLNGPSSR